MSSFEEKNFNNPDIFREKVSCSPPAQLFHHQEPRCQWRATLLARRRRIGCPCRWRSQRSRRLTDFGRWILRSSCCPRTGVDQGLGQGKEQLWKWSWLGSLKVGLQPSLCESFNATGNRMKLKPCFYPHVVKHFEGVDSRAHNLCHGNRQLIVLAINCNHSASKKIPIYQN